MCVSLIQLALMTAFYSMWWLEDNSFDKINCYLKVWCNHHVAAYFETSALNEVHILYPFSPQQHYNAVTITIPRSKIKPLLLKCSKQNLFVVDSVFLTLLVCEFSIFFFINGIFLKTKAQKLPLSFELFLIKVGLSPCRKNVFYLLQWKPFKNH